MEVNKTIEKYKNLIVLVIFVGFFLVGLSIYDNYGVHWDEYHNQDLGLKWSTYIKKTIEEGYPLHLESDLYNMHRYFKVIPDIHPLTIQAGPKDFTHGPAFELLLYMIAKIFDLTDSREIILMRHVSTFIVFFFSVFIFYLLCRNAFDDWKIGLLGSLFLVIHPRIFSHSFYNTFDIGFLAFYIISTYTLTQFLKKKTYFSAFFHSLACAILIDIRVAGLILPICTLLLCGLEILSIKNTGDWLKKLAVYSILLATWTYLFWPYLWSNPIENFLNALEYSKFSETAKFGFQALPSPPWYYNAFWLLVTTPIIYSVFFLIGVFSFCHTIVTKPTGYFKKNPTPFIAVTLFILPIVLPIMLDTRLFDGWRHHFFVYPMFIFISLLGVRCLFYLSTNYLNSQFRLIIYFSFSCIVLVGLLGPLRFLYENHPHENTYLNVIGKRYTQTFNKLNYLNHGALDYWGLSYRKLLEHLLVNNHGTIKVHAIMEPAWTNARILLPQDRQRLEYVDAETADFLVTNYRYGKVPKYFDAYYMLEVDGQRIAGAYKRNEKKQIEDGDNSYNN